jgi:hypothetical protein
MRTNFMRRFSNQSFLFLSWFFFGFFSVAIAFHFHPAGLSGRSCSICEIKGTTEGTLVKVLYEGSVSIDPISFRPFPGLSSAISSEPHFSFLFHIPFAHSNKSPPVSSRLAE